MKNEAEASVDGHSDDWLLSLGITDRMSAQNLARDSQRQLESAAVEIVVNAGGQLTQTHLIALGFAARAISLHHGAVTMIGQQNSAAAFALLRPLIENAAGVLYAKDHPDLRGKFFQDPDLVDAVTIGRIKNYAKRRFGNLDEVYGTLSQLAHPHPRGVIASMSNHDQQRFRWSAMPGFKAERDELTAWAWCREFATATVELLWELVATEDPSGEVLIFVD